MFVYLVILGVLAFSYIRLPSAFLPSEDQGYMITDIQLAPGATQPRTLETAEQMEKYFTERPAVAGVISILGFSFSGVGQNAGLAFTMFKDWSERSSDESAMKSLYLAIREASKRWRGVHHWKPAMQVFQIPFGEECVPINA